ncbi:MAG: hypothetical protein HC907_11500 [Richelia sp. SM1_7_0]|nr:hypothetical protein [Richelia sp. SM1_7_0]
MPRSTIEERSTLRDIKRNHKSLELKNAWFWVVYQAKSGLQLISEERNETGMLLDIFKENEYECYEIRSTGICIITVRPKNTKIMPVAYFKICPIYEPFAIADLLQIEICQVLMSCH